MCEYHIRSAKFKLRLRLLGIRQCVLNCFRKLNVLWVEMLTRHFRYAALMFLLQFPVRIHPVSMSELFSKFSVVCIFFSCSSCCHFSFVFLFCFFLTYYFRRLCVRSDHLSACLWRFRQAFTEMFVTSSALTNN